MVLHGLLRIVAIIGVLCVPLFLFNPWVYAYNTTPLYTRVIGFERGVEPGLYECIGFTLLPIGVDNLRVIPGDLVCTVENKPVFDSLRIYLNTTIGYWIYKDIALYYANLSTTRELEIIVEKPATNATIKLVLTTRNNSHIVTIDTSNTNKYTLQLPPGESIYKISLITEASRKTREVFRVGFYIK